MEIISRTEAKCQGATHYFTGKKCKHNHVSKRRTRDGKCLDCDKMYGEDFRKKRPEVMKEWREQHPEYASKKYQENKKARKQQSKEWYEANKEHHLKRHKEWYHDPRNQEQIKESRRQWYKDNPDYDKKYYYSKHEHMLTEIKPQQRKKYYKKRRQLVQENFQYLATQSILPGSPSEHDLKYWLAGEIIRQTGWFVYKEIVIGESSRIDLLIPEQKIGIELKVSDMYGTSLKAQEQQKRYQLCLPDYIIFLVSLDGSVGISVEHFLTEVLSS